MTPRQRGVGMTIIAAGALVVIIVAAIGVLVLASSVNSGNSATKTSNCCTDASLNLSTPCSTILFTPNYPPLQRLEQSIETDPSFIAAEDGHNYTANGGVSCGFAVNPGSYNGTTVDVGFTYTTDNQYTNNCGNVWNIIYYLTVKVPLTEAGYDMSAIQIIPNNSQEITVTCTSST